MRERFREVAGSVARDEALKCPRKWGGDVHPPQQPFTDKVGALLVGTL